MTRFEKKVLYALEQFRRGDPLKDFLDDYDIIQALEALEWYIENYYD